MLLEINSTLDPGSSIPPESEITMATSEASPPVNIGFTCTDEELFMALEKLIRGSPLPSNVITGISPYGCDPQHLPGDIWFLISSKEKNNIEEHGFWKVSKEACEVFSNDGIIGWRTTLEYFKGQAPHEHKTDWVMQVFNATLKRLTDDNEKKEASSLCRVFLVPSHEMQLKAAIAGIVTETRNHLSQPPLDANSSSRRGSSRNTEVNKHDEIEVLAGAERLPVPEHQGENIDDNDCFLRSEIGFLSGDDYLELLDLDNPASSSSSENSSIISISSDECFDSMAFLQDLEDPILEQNDASKKLNVSASKKPDEVVVVPATLGSLVSVGGNNSGSHEFFETAGYVTSSASGSRDLNNKVAKRAKGDQGSGEGPSSSTCKPSTSSENHVAAAGGRKRAAFGGMRKLGKKYLCFMPF
ncbi:hypothetical protein PTKIN_Ptkin09bG0124800 [Pterospermum kingtungense]